MVGTEGEMTIRKESLHPLITRGTGMDTLILTGQELEKGAGAGARIQHIVETIGTELSIERTTGLRTKIEAIHLDGEAGADILDTNLLFIRDHHED